MPIINKEKIFNICKKKRIIKEIANYCCSEKIINKDSFILRRLQMVYKHHQIFSLTELRNQMSIENEILRRCFFLWDTLSVSKFGT